MAITLGDHLIDSGHHDITPEQEREIEAREECARRGLDPDDDAADGALVWMVVDQDMREKRRPPVSEAQRKLDASVTPRQAAESVRREREALANRDKPHSQPDGFINDYD